MNNRSNFSPREVEPNAEPIRFNDPETLDQISRILANNKDAEEGTLKYFLSMVDTAIILAEKRIEFEGKPVAYWYSFAEAVRVGVKDAYKLVKLAPHASLARTWGHNKVRIAHEKHTTVPNLSWQGFLREITPKLPKGGDEGDPVPAAAPPAETPAAVDPEIVAELRSAADLLFKENAALEADLRRERDRVFELETALAKMERDRDEWRAAANPTPDPVDPVSVPPAPAPVEDVRDVAWFKREVLAVTSGICREALITVTDDGVSLYAHSDHQTTFLRAVLPLIEGVETAAWLNIKAKSFETANPRRIGAANIAAIQWSYIFDSDQVAAAVARETEMIRPAMFGQTDGPRNLTYASKHVKKLMRKKPQLWGLSDKGLLGAVLERDGLIYEYFIRAGYIGPHDDAPPPDPPELEPEEQSPSETDPEMLPPEPTPGNFAGWLPAREDGKIIGWLKAKRGRGRPKVYSWNEVKELGHQ